MSPLMKALQTNFTLSSLKELINYNELSRETRKVYKTRGKKQTEKTRTFWQFRKHLSSQALMRKKRLFSCIYLHKKASRSWSRLLLWQQGHGSGDAQLLSHYWTRRHLRNKCQQLKEESWMTHCSKAWGGCRYQAVALSNQRSKLFSTAVHHIDSWLHLLLFWLQSVFTRLLNVHI